jgi:excisionase family DNA binding protein
MQTKGTSAPASEIMTVASLALYLHCHQSTIYRLIKTKKIPAFKIGSDWRLRRSDIDDWIARQHEDIGLPSRGRKPNVR